MADGENSGSIFILKLFSMLIMFFMIMITGSLPLRWERFRKSSKLISLASAFSGGLFLAVGILHLLPEANEKFEDYYKTQPPIKGDRFPWSNFICVACFALILFIEKVLFASFTGEHDHNHAHGDDEVHAHIVVPPKDAKKNSVISLVENINTALWENAKDSVDSHSHVHHHAHKDDCDEITQEKAQKRSSVAYRLAQKTRRSSILAPTEPKISKLTPYILQIAIGIHATFEGMAIGIETEFAGCFGIALAVICHKWAEGLTLGLAFFKADVDVKTATIMIGIQAIMNPLGILIGWLLSNQGAVVTGVFQSISAGTFLYIACGEVIVNEFNLKRFRVFKFFLFCIAIGFVTLLFFIEQWTEPADD